MQALLNSGHEGKIGLIYIDPPFWTNKDYYASFEIGDITVTKVAYKDTWEGTDSFLDMPYPRLQLMRRLLASNVSIFCEYRSCLFQKARAIKVLPFCREGH